MEHIAERYSTVVKETNKKLPLYGPQKVWQKALPAVRALHTYNIFISFRVFIIVQYMPAQLEVRKVRLWGSESIKRDYLPALSIHYNNVNFFNVIAVKFNCFFFYAKLTIDAALFNIIKNKLKSSEKAEKLFFFNLHFHMYFFKRLKSLRNSVKVFLCMAYILNNYSSSVRKN